MKSILLAFVVFCCILNVRGARRVDVEELVKEVETRYADEFQRLNDEGTPPGLEQKLDLDKKEGLEEKTEVKTEKAGEKVRLEQTFNGIPVFDTVITVTKDKKTGDLTKDPRGSIIKEIADDVKETKAKLSKEDALKIAIEDSGNGDAEDIMNEEAELNLYYEDAKNKASLSYIVNFESPTGGEDGAPSRPFYIVNADTGDILDKWEGMTTGKTYKMITGVGGNKKVGKYNYGAGSRAKLRVTEKDKTNCYTANEKVTVVNSKNTKDQGGKKATEDKYVNCAKGAQDEVNDGYSAINDAIRFGEVIYDMHNDWLGKHPLNNKYKLKMRVHYDKNYENAFWNGKEMTFGDGKNSFYPLVALDVTAHEIAHGFTEQFSGLVYQGESGGMNEAYSDIAGTAAKFFAYNQVNWDLGSDIFKRKNAALRYMNNPTKDGRSIDHKKNYYDGLNVHYSSGIYNKAFYNLATTRGWDIKKAFTVFAKANMLYWKRRSTFDEGACGVNNAAKDEGKSVEDVKKAFKSVGVECKSKSLVTNEA